MGFVGNLKKVGLVYHYRFMARGLVHHGSTGCESLTEAKVVVARLITKAYDGEAKPAQANAQHDTTKRSSSRTLGELIDKWQRDMVPLVGPSTIAESNWKPTVTSLRKHFADLLATPLDEIDTEKVNAAVARYLGTVGRNPGRGGNPVERTHTTEGAIALLKRLKTVMLYGVRLTWITKLPYKIPRPRTTPIKRHTADHRTMDQFFHLVDRAENPHMGTAVRLMIGLGLREKEALGLRWEGIQWEAKACFPTLTKTGEARRIPIPDFLLMHLQGLPGRLASGLIMPSTRNKSDDQDHPHSARFTAKAIESAGWKVEFDKLGEADALRLFQKIDHGSGPWIRILARLMLYMGLTESQARRVCWEGFHWDDAEYCHPMGGKGWEQPISVPKPLVEALKELFVEAKGRVVAIPMGRHKKTVAMKSGDATRAIARAWKALKFPRLTPHRLRATFASLHANKLKTPLSRLMRMLGHARLETTQLYLEVDEEDLQDDQAGYSRLLSKP